MPNTYAKKEAALTAHLPELVPSTINWSELYEAIKDHERTHPNRPLTDILVEHWASPDGRRLSFDLKAELVEWMGNLGYKYRRGSATDPSGRKVAWRKDGRERNYGPVNALKNQSSIHQRQIRDLDQLMDDRIEDIQKLRDELAEIRKRLDALEAIKS